MSGAPTSTQRWSIALRTLAAVVGGYALTCLLTLALPLLLAQLGVNRPQALLSATMASFLVYAGIVMAVFHARSVMRTYAWMTGAVLSLGGIVWLLMPGVRA